MPEEIGEGLQYRVFAVGDGRVKKVPKTREEMVSHARKWHDSEQKVEENVEEALRRREKAVERLKKASFDLYLFGNLEFEGDVAYQDRVTPAGEVLEKKGRRVVDDYIELIERLWALGIGDTIYNFTINTGYAGEEMKMIDFGEIVFDRKKVEEEIEDEKWLEQWSYTEDLPEDLKPYFRKRMREDITVEKLGQLWKEGLDD